VRWVWRLAALAFLFLTRGEPPELKAVHPIGAGRGTTNVYTLAGKFDPWPPKFWSDPPGLTFKAETNKNKVIIEIPADAAPGARLIRVYNDDGASEPKFFVVGADRELEEKEPNNHLAEAQEATLPATFNGRLDKNEDVDCYKIHLAAGAWLDASLEAYTLMSKIDGVFKLVTTNGITLAWNHDYETFDPHLWWRAPSEQTVILQVFGFAYPAGSEIRLSGGEEAFYRLHLAATAPPAWRDSEVPNTPVALPLEIYGTISAAGEEDKIPFAGKKDQSIEARVEAASLGAPLDAWLKIVDTAGKEIARQDDANGSADPRLEWKCTSDTNFFFVVGSTLNRGGSNYHYRLTARLAPPDFTATWAASALVINANSTNSVKMNLKRLRDHTNDIAPQFRGLPTGVTAITQTLTNKSGEVSFTLNAATNAAPFQGPILLALIDSQTKTEKFVITELTTRGENNGVPNGYAKLAIESYDTFWLTVKPAATNAPAVTNTASK
jgi:hypothetical protein